MKLRPWCLLGFYFAVVVLSKRIWILLYIAFFLLFSFDGWMCVYLHVTKHPAIQPVNNGEIFLIAHEEPQLTQLPHEKKTCHKQDLNLSREDNNFSPYLLKLDPIDLKFEGYRGGLWLTYMCMGHKIILFGATTCSTTTSRWPMASGIALMRIESCPLVKKLM